MTPGRGARRGRTGCGGRVRPRRPPRASCPAGPAARTRGDPSSRRSRRAPSGPRRPPGGPKPAACARPTRGDRQPASAARRAGRAPPRRGKAPSRGGGPPRGPVPCGRARARRGGPGSRCRPVPRRPWPRARRRTQGRSARAARPARSPRPLPRRCRWRPGRWAWSRCEPSPPAGSRAGVSNTPITLRERPRPGTATGWTATVSPARVKAPRTRRCARASARDAAGRGPQEARRTAMSYADGAGGAAACGTPGATAAARMARTTAVRAPPAR